MPYESNNDLPDSVKGNLPEAAQTIWRKTFNAVYARTKDEQQAARIAWYAVKQAGYGKNKDGKWVKVRNDAAEDVEIEVDIRVNMAAIESIGDEFEISNYNPDNESDEELLALHAASHRWFGSQTTFTGEQLVKFHTKLAREICARKIDHTVYGTLDNTLPEVLKR